MKYNNLDGNRESAKTSTPGPEAVLETLNRLLLDVLRIDHMIEWEKLRDKVVFPVPAPSRPQLFDLPESPTFGALPTRTLLGKLLALLPFQRLKIESARAEALEAWQIQCDKVQSSNDRLNYLHECQVVKWQKDKQQWLIDRECQNAMLDTLRLTHEQCFAAALEFYWHMVLSSSEHASVAISH